MKKKVVIASILFFTLSLLSCIYITKLRDIVEMNCYDVFHQNTYVSSKQEIEKILSSFEVVTLQQLPKEYLEHSHLSSKKYRSLVQTIKFYKISKADCYRKIVGDNRIMKLISRDARYNKAWYFSSDTLYWGIDKRILFKVLELQDILTQKGYDRDGFQLRSGHRTPFYNTQIRGASKSRHIKGQAVDMTIGDINKDGTFTKEDKDIVLDICETQVIKNKGGIGLYPGTRSVHIDVRGYRARWNSY